MVTGIPMEFQFGTNWAKFSNFAGGVIGTTPAMEGMFAFFAESVFLGVFLAGRDRVSPFVHWLSALFIVGLLTTMAAGLYPSVLPAREGDPFGLTIDNAIAGDTVLHTALVRWPIGILLAAVYFTFAYRLFFRGAGPPTLGSEPPA